MLQILPMICILVGLALYGILAGADFGAGFWQIAAGRGPLAESIRQHAHDSMAPVWEANHVWLIFVLTVTWTCYPRALGSIASTLAFALALAGLGILARGAAYAMRTGTSAPREERRIDAVLGGASIITPFALGAAVGGIASGRVPVGNAAGNVWTSWLNPTSIVVGILAVATGAYLSAVFLCGDAMRREEPEVAEQFRVRALVLGVVAGAIAVAGLVVLALDANHLFRALVTGKGLPALIVSALAGSATIALVWTRRYEPARAVSALAVAAIVAGWALAQSPEILPGLSVKQAAASHATLVAVLVSIAVGGVLLFPSLATLFRLALGGKLTGGETALSAGAADAPATAARAGFLIRIAGALWIAGFALVNVADAAWAHVIGAACFLAFVAIAFRVAVPVD